MNRPLLSLAVSLALVSCRAESPTQPQPSATTDPVPTSSASALPTTEPTATASTTASSKPVDAPVRDTIIGGQNFDKWVAEGFKADDSKTKSKADGTGGPNKDGTLLTSDGKPFLNDTGHDYRLKNLFGWDLRGKAGIYGPEMMNKAYAVDINLLERKDSAADLAAWLKSGTKDVPAFGAVMSDAQLADVAAFIVGVRDRTLVHPADVFEIRKGTPGNYTLRAGGNADKGKALIKERCATCHGEDGTTLLFDDKEYSLGMHSRQKAYEDWQKILNGQPRSPMGRQVKGDNKQMTQEMLDIFAALCDRKAFPKGPAKGKDVADKDARCGSYLR